MGQLQVVGVTFRRAHHQGKHVIHPSMPPAAGVPLYPDAAPRAIPLPWLVPVPRGAA